MPTIPLLESPLLSIVIPTLEEQETLPALLGDLEHVTVAHEIIVADGGSRDGTRAIAMARATLVDAPRGRGRQLAAGANAARGRLLCFLHADVRMPPAAARLLDILAVVPPAGAAAFRLRIDAPGLLYRIIERGTNARSRVLGLPYGDQGLVLTRALYQRAGGYPDLPLMEDLAFVRTLSRLAPVTLLPVALHVSARRWERDGVVRRTLGNWLILASWMFGATPASLARRYDRQGSAD